MTVREEGKERSNWRSGAKRILAQYSPLVIFAMLSIVLAVIEPDFRKPNNLATVAERTCIVGIVAIGETLVIIAGGIDLSVGSVAALSGVVGALAMTSWGLPMPVGIALGSITGLLCGFINGFLSTKARLPAFIATLGMMMAARGAAMLLTDGMNVYRLPEAFKFLGGTGPQGRVVPLAITLVIAVFFSILLTYTRYGRTLFATGGNAAGARLSGVPTDRVRILAFSVAGLLTGFAGMMLTSRTGIGDPKAAEGMELDAIAACVIGGASLMGGEGGVLGSLAGALIMNVLVNFFTLSDYKVYWQNVLIGGLIIGLVFYDTLRKRRAGLIKDV
ncbi:MAG: ABC transporter permease [FCB group bacterium]|nr:ABC transporter permease [FCB group bacterium]